ncbi:hypothetical protein BDA96_06G258200 [Sorghum bicolor]|uniref:Uncharacterized protein n=1 Tax=Sorghum bicolor TaxID=4558 RepID=A0A921UDP8_SORBI|nr:hypothetical protein BDA96_06G258200 [Sorghum bicolor]
MRIGRSCAARRDLPYCSLQWGALMCCPSEFRKVTPMCARARAPVQTRHARLVSYVPPGVHLAAPDRRGRRFHSPSLSMIGDGLQRIGHVDVDPNRSLTVRTHPGAVVFR